MFLFCLVRILRRNDDKTEARQNEVLIVFMLKVKKINKHQLTIINKRFTCFALMANLVSTSESSASQYYRILVNYFFDILTTERLFSLNIKFSSQQITIFRMHSRYLELGWSSTAKFLLTHFFLFCFSVAA